MTDTPRVQILKCRDDPQPVFLVPTENLTAKFKLRDDKVDCSWIGKSDPIDTSKLRQQIEPWLTALCQSEHLSLLVGSGLTCAVHQLATDKILRSMQEVTFTCYQDVINAESKRSAQATARNEGNIEDSIRAANELLRGLEILGSNDEKAAENATKLSDSIKNVLHNFAADILKGERQLIAASVDKRELAFNYLVSFLMSFASRTGVRERLHIFTTNYDRFIEAGAEAAGLHLLDRFVGSLAPIFRSS